MKLTRSQPPGSVRIIAGDWRGRRLPVPAQDVRPTPDRVRETLFNWLQNKVAGADCLDLFAGTGALGFEAASRGARSVVLVEQDYNRANNLMQMQQILQADQVEVLHHDALVWLQRSDRTFDIIFLDPPFASGLLVGSLALLDSRAILRPGGLVYAELGNHQSVPPAWRVHKQTRAGRVQAGLLMHNGQEAT